MSANDQQALEHGCHISHSMLSVFLVFANRWFVKQYLVRHDFQGTMKGTH